MPKSIDFRQQDDLTDQLVTQLLQLLTAFLPINGSERSFDRSPPFELFRISLLLGRTTELMRNDSIADMSKRSQLCRALLAFVTTVAKHPGLVRILTEKRVEKKRSPGLHALGEGKNKEALVVDRSTNGLGASLYSYGNDIHKQAKAYMTVANKNVLGKELQTG
jgi:baculoviral IAP repeat-containing protein 6